MFLWNSGRGGSPGWSWSQGAMSCIILGLPFLIYALLIPWYGLAQNLLRAASLLIVFFAYLGVRYCVARENDFVATPLSEDYPSELVPGDTDYD